ncbi:eae-like domain protein [Citrobacter portucalensis]|uniref:Eae-like domain protein n=1 Tax=Citrobacter portucalensis TaxID=1639133 RepID=A0AAW9ETU0_9ENTR|nr:eae-like domain protein [Citrobacter portucalensis]MDX7149485.1 eae-like domain protein [Citrobacter portucalensis]
MKPTYEELELQLEESQREFRAADATIHNLELKLTDMAVQLANAESKCRELAEFKSRVYAQMGAGCEAPEFSITEGLSNLRRFADTLHAIEREFFTKEVPDEECEGETVEECPLCWGMTVEQYVSEFGKCLAEVRAQGVERMIEVKQQQLDGMHPDTFAIGAVRDSIRRDIYELKVFAEILRQEAAQ